MRPSKVNVAHYARFISSTYLQYPHSPLVEIRGLIRPSSELTNIVWYEYDAPDMPSCPWNAIGTLCLFATSQTKILPVFRTIHKPTSIGGCCNCPDCAMVAQPKQGSPTLSCVQIPHPNILITRTSDEETGIGMRATLSI